MGELVGLFGVMIPLAPFLLGGFALWMRHQQKLMEHQRKLADSTAQVSAEKAAQYAAHNRELEERVRVLERIVTDRGYDIAAQIEALRDTHRVETDENNPAEPR
jgi:hypothetical protein